MGGLLPVAAFLLCTLSSGCTSGYYARLAYEQMRFLNAATPIADELQRTTDEERRARLGLVLQVRQFSADNGLDPGGSYLEVSDVNQSTVAHVVTAAHPDRLEPYTWRYPFVGEIPYRGYFERERAESFASALRDKGLDTLIVPAGAYSTLGWFDDPLPSSLLETDRVSLATTVIHEVVHQRLFVKGDIAFNETLANAVALRLAPAFFDGLGQSERGEEARKRHRVWLERSDFYDELYSRLDEFFETAEGERLARREVLARRKEIYAEAQQEYRRRGLDTGRRSGFLEGELDNARFMALHRYAKQAGLMEGFLASYPDTASALASLERVLTDQPDAYRALAISAGLPEKM